MYGDESIPADFIVPREYLALQSARVDEIGPWFFPGEQSLEMRIRGLRERYPEAVLLPFAKRMDNDDIACWTPPFPTVCVLHDFSTWGWERRREFPDIRSWLHWAVDDILDATIWRRRT